MRGRLFNSRLGRLRRNFCFRCFGFFRLLIGFGGFARADMLGFGLRGAAFGFALGGFLRGLFGGGIVFRLRLHGKLFCRAAIGFQAAQTLGSGFGDGTFRLPFLFRFELRQQFFFGNFVAAFFYNHFGVGCGHGFSVSHLLFLMRCLLRRTNARAPPKWLFRLPRGSRL